MRYNNKCHLVDEDNDDDDDDDDDDYYYYWSGSARRGSGIPVHPKKIRQNTQN